MKAWCDTQPLEETCLQSRSADTNIRAKVRRTGLAWALGTVVKEVQYDTITKRALSAAALFFVRGGSSVENSDYCVRGTEATHVGFRTQFVTKDLKVAMVS